MSTPGEDPAERLPALYGAFNDRDIDGALAGMAPDVAWPNGWEGGHVHGHEAVLVDQVVRDLCGTVIATGGVVHAYRLSGGLVTEMEIREPTG